jgi:hypothetical protein
MCGVRAFTGDKGYLDNETNLTIIQIFIEKFNRTMICLWHQYVLIEGSIKQNFRSSLVEFVYL